MSFGALLLLLLVTTVGFAPAACRIGRKKLSRRGNATEDLQQILANRDYWERLVGTPSRLAQVTVKEGVLPLSKYSRKDFDVRPFQIWLRNYSLLPSSQRSSRPTSSSLQIPTPTAAAIYPPPLSDICGVWINPTYKFIFIRNRKTASSTFLTAVRKFMLEAKLCSVPREASQFNNCTFRLEPDHLARSGVDIASLWKQYTVITSTRNPWARAASAYQFTHDKWQRRDGACAKPTFLEFCRDPFIMGKISNLYNCVDQREGVGPRQDGHWNFDFCHVEPAAPCMVDEAGKFVSDFVIRYERLDEDMHAAVELINSRRPAGVPPLVLPPTIKWRNKGSAVQSREIDNSNEAAYVYADKFRQCGESCVQALADFYASDLKLFGWDRPDPAPAPLSRN